MLQVANEDAIADLVCCGEVYEVEVPVTIPDNFKVQVLDSLVNFFLGDVHCCTPSIMLLFLASVASSTHLWSVRCFR